MLFLFIVLFSFSFLHFFSISRTNDAFVMYSIVLLTLTFQTCFVLFCIQSNISRTPDVRYCSSLIHLWYLLMSCFRLLFFYGCLFNPNHSGFFIFILSKLTLIGCFFSRSLPPFRPPSTPYSLPPLSPSPSPLPPSPCPTPPPTVPVIKLRAVLVEE